MSKWKELKVGDVVPKGAQARSRYEPVEWRDSVIVGKTLDENRVLFYEYRAPVIETLAAPTCAGWWWRRYKLECCEAQWAVVRIINWNGDFCETDETMDDILPLDSRCEWVGPITPPDV